MESEAQGKLIRSKEVSIS